MITILNGRMTIPDGERFIGYLGDNLTSEKLFEVIGGSDLHVYILNLKFESGIKTAITLASEVYETGVKLRWLIERTHLYEKGIVSAQISAIGQSGEVWHSNEDYFELCDSIEFSGADIPDNHSQSGSFELKDLSVTTQKLANRAVTPSKASFFKSGKNKFNPDWSESGKLTDKTEGANYKTEIASEPGFKTSDYIFVPLGRQSVLSHDVYAYAFYDKNKKCTYVRDFYPQNPVRDYVFMPVYDCYIRFTYAEADENSMMLEHVPHNEHGIYTPTGYEPYKYILDAEFDTSSICIPEKLSELENDAGYITEAAISSGEKPWRKLTTVTLSQNVRSITVDKDSDGKQFSITEAAMYFNPFSCDQSAAQTANIMFNGDASKKYHDAISVPKTGDITSRNVIRIINFAKNKMIFVSQTSSANGKQGTCTVSNAISEDTHEIAKITLEMASSSVSFETGTTIEIWGR